jgi:hypothetical protein
VTRLKSQRIVAGKRESSSLYLRDWLEPVSTTFVISGIEGYKLCTYIVNKNGTFWSAVTSRFVRIDTTARVCSVLTSLRAFVSPVVGCHRGSRPGRPPGRCRQPGRRCGRGTVALRPTVTLAAGGGGGRGGTEPVGVTVQVPTRGRRCRYGCS